MPPFNLPTPALRLAKGAAKSRTRLSPGGQPGGGETATPAPAREVCSKRAVMRSDGAGKARGGGGI